MFSGLDDIRWEELNHAYGSAEDVPDMLYALTSDDFDQRIRARDGLEIAVLHQGSIYNSTVQVIPFLLRMLEQQDTFERDWILGYLGSIASSSYHGERFLLSSEGKDMYLRRTYLDNPQAVYEETLQIKRDARTELHKGMQVFYSLLNDDDPIIQCAAIGLLFLFEESLDEIRARLTNHLKKESNDLVRAAIVCGFGIMDFELKPTQNTPLISFINPDEAPVTRLTAALFMSYGSEDSRFEKQIIDAIISEPQAYIEYNKFAPYFRRLLDDRSDLLPHLNLNNIFKRIEPAQFPELVPVFAELYKSTPAPHIDEQDKQSRTLAFTAMYTEFDRSIYLENMLRFAFTKSLSPQTTVEQLTSMQRLTLEYIHEAQEQWHIAAKVLSQSLYKALLEVGIDCNDATNELKAFLDGKRPAIPEE